MPRQEAATAAACKPDSQVIIHVPSLLPLAHVTYLLSLGSSVSFSASAQGSKGRKANAKDNLSVSCSP